MAQESACFFTVQSPAASGRDLVRLQSSGFSQDVGFFLFVISTYADDGIIGFADKS